MVIKVTILALEDPFVNQKGLSFGDGAVEDFVGDDRENEGLFAVENVVKLRVVSELIWTGTCRWCGDEKSLLGGFHFLDRGFLRRRCGH